MVKSNTKIKKQAAQKSNPDVVRIIHTAKKLPAWRRVAEVLSTPTRKRPSCNLFKIDSLAAAGDTVVIPGKVLASGSLTKKLKICALSMSPAAMEKLKESKSEFVPLSIELEKNKKGEGIKIVT